MPNELSNETSVISENTENFLAVDVDFTLFASLTENYLKQECELYKDRFFCESLSVFERANNGDCLIYLFSVNENGIKDNCELRMSDTEEIVLQPNGTDYFVYSKK